MPTQQAFVSASTWNDETRTDPAMKWMEGYTHAFDTADFDLVAKEYSAYPYTFIKSDGTETKTDSPEELAKTFKDSYGGFTKYTHIPYYISNVETDYGWECVGLAHVYANLPGEAGSAEPAKVKYGGEEWDVKVPGAFHFQYVKDSNAKHGGILLRRTEICSESLQVAMTLVKRGVIKLG